MVGTREAAVACRGLNGVACIYKPFGKAIKTVQQTIISNLCRELNEMDIRPPDKRIEIIGSTTAPMKVVVTDDFADHPLVVGKRYQNADFKVNYATHLSRNTSGVLLLGINSGTKDTYRLNIARLTRAYKVHGILGKATDTYFVNGKVVEKASFKHVTRPKIDKVVSYIQSMHQKKMYELCGVDMNSQAGYELATMGPIRPATNDLPVVYGIKCVSFEPPNFIIEIQSVNEYEKYLHTLIHDIGIQLRTTATCTAVQCIRHGKFTLDNALLSKHWTLQHILDSIKESREIIHSNLDLIRPRSAALQ